MTHPVYCGCGHSPNTHGAAGCLVTVGAWRCPCARYQPDLVLAALERPRKRRRATVGR